MGFFRGLFFVAVAFVYSLGAFAEAIPECMDGARALPIDNAQVLEWKTTTPNQYLGRARVKGHVVRIFPDRNGHDHFEIKIGPNANDTLEVVYNESFGALPGIQVGTEVEACGDYITSIAETEYPISPSGAIIHWVHGNPRNKGHAHGYLIIGGKLYGFNYRNAGRSGDDRQGRDHRRRRNAVVETPLWLGEVFAL